MKRVLAGALLLAAACDRRPESVPSAEAGPAPQIEVAIRGSIVAGRPVPLRLTLSNETADVIVPVSASFENGKGEARWGRAILGEVVYDASSDRFFENPEAQVSSPNLIYRSVLMPGERLVEDLDVRYQTLGTTKERARVVFHRLTASEFEQRVYVAVGGMMPRRFQPVGLLPEGPPRTGALLAGFFLRSERPTETAVTEFSFEIPALPAVIVKKIEAAGLSPERAIAADWAGGWASGDAEHSVVIAPTGATKSLAGVPFSAMHVIDDSVGNISFCVTGASRSEIEPLFPGYEIVPHKCLHVSVPRDEIMATLERISERGYEIKPIAFQLRDALDIVKRGRAPTPAGSPSPSPSATVTKAKPSPTPTSKPAPQKTPAPTPAATASASESAPAATDTPEKTPEATPETTATPAPTPEAEGAPE